MGFRRSDQLHRTTAGMNMLLNALAQRTMVGERAKDRALEREKISYDLKSLKQKGDQQRARNALELLQADVTGKIQMKQADIQAAQVQMQGAKLRNEITVNRQRMLLQKKTFDLQAAESIARLSAMSSNEGRAKAEMFRNLVEFNDKKAERAAEMEGKHQIAEQEMGGVISSIFLKKDDNDNIVPKKKYEDLIKNLMVTYGEADPVAVVNNHILPRFHSNFQAISQQQLNAHNKTRTDGRKLTSIMDKDFPFDQRQLVINGALDHTFGAVPDAANPSGGLLVASAIGRLGGLGKAAAMRDEFLQKFPEDGMQRFYASLIGSHRPGGGFTEDPLRAKDMAGYESGGAALRHAQLLATGMVDGLFLKTIMGDALPKYSSSRAARESAAAAFTQLQDMSNTYQTLLGAQIKAIATGNPAGLTPDQIQNIGFNAVTASEQNVTADNVTPEESRDSLARMLSGEGITAVTKDSQTKAGEEEEVSVSSPKKKREWSAGDAPKFGGKTDDHKYGFPNIVENVGDALAFAGKNVAFGVKTAINAPLKANEVLQDAVMGATVDEDGNSIAAGAIAKTGAWRWLTGEGPRPYDVTPPAAPPRQGSLFIPYAETQNTGGPRPESRYSAWVKAAQSLVEKNTTKSEKVEWDPDLPRDTPEFSLYKRGGQYIKD